MNERIQQLAEQAGIHFGRSATLDGNNIARFVTTSDMEKFAELIVQECIAQCEQVATAADVKSKSKFVTDDGRMLHEGMWGGAKNCSGQIREHFGVAE
jgi:hypothetical protein